MGKSASFNLNLLFIILCWNACTLSFVGYLHDHGTYFILCSRRGQRNGAKTIVNNKRAAADITGNIARELSAIGTIKNESSKFPQGETITHQTPMLLFVSLSLINIKSNIMPEINYSCRNKEWVFSHLGIIMN